MKRSTSLGLGSRAALALACGLGIASSLASGCGKAPSDDGDEHVEPEASTSATAQANGTSSTQPQAGVNPVPSSADSTGSSTTSGTGDEDGPSTSAANPGPLGSGPDDASGATGAGGQDNASPSATASGLEPSPDDTSPAASDSASPPDNSAPSGTDAAPEGSTSEPPAPAPEWKEGFPNFVSHTIAEFQGGYFTAVFDVDGDGLLDVLGLSSGAAGLVWFKNPTWDKFTITTGTERFICAAPYDVDGDGDTDLAFASEFDLNDSNNGGTIYWAETPDDPTMNEEWTLHAVDAIPTSHRVRFADIDGDGKKELLVLPIFGIGSSAPTRAGAVQLEAYWIAEDPTAEWESEVIDDSRLEVAHGISVVDWDGDGTEDILTAANDGVDLFRPSLEASVLHVGAGKDGEQPDRGSSEVGLGRLGSERFVATIEPWHGTDMVIYTPGADQDELWAREVIGADFEHGHGMVVADLNADGYDEVVGGGGQGDLAQLIYRYVPSSSAWETIELDVGGVAVSGIEVGDLNGDGALDIVTIGGSPTNNVVWYENVR